jgi:pyroglutamyl-peptidase
MRTVLVTGFGPFPGAPYNPTGPLVRTLARRPPPALSGLRLVPHVFATTYLAVDRELPVLIAQYRPAAVIMFGLAARTHHVRIEMQARNAMSSLPDASGDVAVGSIIEADSPESLPILAPHERLLQSARRGRIPARLSQDAGSYLCNYLYWRALKTAAQPPGPEIVAFIHIPESRHTTLRKGGTRRLFAFADLVRTGGHVLTATAAALDGASAHDQILAMRGHRPFSHHN